MITSNNLRINKRLNGKLKPVILILWRLDCFELSLHKNNSLYYARTEGSKGIEEKKTLLFE